MPTATRTVILLTTMTALTLLSFLLYPTYRPAGEELLLNPDFQDGLTAWEKGGESRHSSHLEDNTVILTQEDTKYRTRLIQHIRGEDLAGSYRLAGEMRAQSIKNGEKEWHRGGLVLVRYDENQKRIASYTAAVLDGTNQWTKYETVIDLPSPTPHITVVARLLNATGELHLRSLSLMPMEKQAFADILRFTLIGLWAITVMAIVFLSIQTWGISLPLIIFGILGALALTGTLMPKSLVVSLDIQIIQAAPTGFSSTISSFFETLFPGYIKNNSQIVSKLGHWLIFSLMALVAALLFRRSSLLFIIFTLLVLAAATEAMQLLTSGRNPHIYDFAIDAIGVATGLLLALPLRYLINRTRDSDTQPTAE